jgi:hypothetical protein
MRRTVCLATGVAAVGFVAVVGMPTAVAATVDCAVYPDACVESEVVEDGVVVQDETTDRSNVADNRSTPSTLPFTGGEVVLLSLAGAGAVVAGTVLVLSARRRSATSA